MALPAAAEATVLTFGVPLKAASDPAEWLQLCGRLSDTVRSVYNQTNPAFRIVIACDRMPDLAFATDDRLEFLPVSSPVISTREEGDIDAGRKRWLIARWFTLGGGGYLMFLDADDLVSNRLVSFVHKTRHQSGYVFETGYGLSVATQSVLPIPQPGIADAPFHPMCGSSTIVLLSADDMDADNDGQSRFNRLFRRGHTTVAAAAKAEGRPMMKMPFPAAVYVLDTGLNLSLARAREEPDFAAEREQWRQAFRQTGFAIARIAREFGLTPALSRAKPWAAIRQASLASFSRAKAALDVAICGMPGRTIDFVRRRQRVHQPPPSVVVLGTSNCIGPRSFVYKLAGSKEAVVRNLSVGASSSTAGLYMLDLVAPTTSGLGILDYAINDSDAAHNLWGEKESRHVIAANVRTISYRLRARGYFPIVAMMPAELMVEPLLGERLYEACCRQNYLNFINLRHMFRMAIRAGVGETALMRDNWHMAERPSELFAGFLGELLVRLSVMPVRKSRRISSALSTRIVPAERLFPPGALVKRSTSLRSEYYGKLAKGSVLNVPIGEGERVAGLMVNVGAKGGTVAIRGSNAQVVKSLTFDWSNHQPEVFFSLLVDIAKPIIGGADCVTIEIVPDEMTPTERTIHGRPAPPGRDGEVEIEGILITSEREADCSFAMTSYCGLPLDLRELPEADRLFAALVGLHS